MEYGTTVVGRSEYGTAVVDGGEGRGGGRWFPLGTPLVALRFDRPRRARAESSEARLAEGQRSTSVSRNLAVRTSRMAALRKALIG